MTTFNYHWAVMSTGYFVLGHEVCSFSGFNIRSNPAHCVEYTMLRNSNPICALIHLGFAFGEAIRNQYQYLFSAFIYIWSHINVEIPNDFFHTITTQVNLYASSKSDKPRKRTCFRSTLYVNLPNKNFVILIINQLHLFFVH